MTKRSRILKRADKARGPETASTPLRGLARQRLLEWLKSLAVALAIWFVLRSVLIEAFRIPSTSMERTLLAGDFLFVNKALYGGEIPFTNIRLPAIREPRRGDIVVFKSRTEARTMVVKRVIGMPGDTIQMRQRAVYLNGISQHESYVQFTDSIVDVADDAMYAWAIPFLLSTSDRRSYRPSRDNWGPVEIPSGSYLVMGDNRDDSYDSRYWGLVPRSAIRGRPILVYYSFDHDSYRMLPFLTAIRWRRIGLRPR